MESYNNNVCMLELINTYCAQAFIQINIFYISRYRNRKEDIYSLRFVVTNDANTYYINTIFSGTEVCLFRSFNNGWFWVVDLIINGFNHCSLNYSNNSEMQWSNQSATYPTTSNSHYEIRQTFQSVVINDNPCKW